MKITISIETDNAAFEDDTGGEAASILRKLAGQLEKGWPVTQGNSLPCMDYNGNQVGKLTVTE